MPNAVDKLFDSVLGSGLEGDPDAHIDEPKDSPNDVVLSPDEEALRDRAATLLTGQRDAFDPDLEEAIEGGIRRLGFDVLAFYKSRRYRDRRPYPGRWGIFYLNEGLLYLESAIQREHPGFGSPRDLARDFLREHERFHFRADLQTLMFEAATKRHLYGPARRNFHGRQSEFVEEALANRQVWEWSKRGVVGLRDFAFDFMKLQPEAYARFDEPRLQLAAEWAANVVDLSADPAAHRTDLSHWVETTPPSLMRASLCPEYIVHPANWQAWLSPVLVLPPVMAVNDGEEVVKRLSKRYASLKDRWERTKEKLIQNRLSHGLNFKPWPKDKSVQDAYSVRVDDGFRAHLKPEGGGHWTAYILGPHKELGHG